MPTATLGELRAAVGGAGLLIIDNASDAYDGPENDRRQVRTFIRELAGLGRGNNAGVMLLAHIDKQAARFGSQGNSYSGSSAWHNSARSRLALVDTRNGNGGRRAQIRRTIRAGLAAILCKVSDKLTPARARVMAPVLLYLLKGVSLAADEEPAVQAAMTGEIRELVRLYLLSVR